MKQLNRFWKNTRGDAVVEATILFPIIMMIFAALVLLSMYLPTRAVLQQATQYAATALATEQSDTWLYFDEEQMEYRWETDKGELSNVYVALIKSFFQGDVQQEAEAIVTNLESNSLVSKQGILSVDCQVVNYIFYKELSVTATKTIPMPVDLSFIHFPTEIPVTVTSTAIVQNGDEFVRNMDIAAEFLDYLSEEYKELDLVFTELKTWIDEAWRFLGV